VTYGEVGVGKTSLLFPPDNEVIFNVAECLLAKAAASRKHCELRIGGCVLEFDTESKAEVTRNCLTGEIESSTNRGHRGPLEGSRGREQRDTLRHGRRSEELTELREGSRAEHSAVGFADLHRLKQLLDKIKINSNNWVRGVGGVKPIHNRGHLFIRLELTRHGEVTTLTVADLAGFLPNTLPTQLKHSLGCDQQLQFTRLGLNQFRSLVHDLAKGEDLGSVSGKLTSKLGRALLPLIAFDCHCFLIGVLRRSTPYAEAVRTLELLEKARHIQVDIGETDSTLKEVAIAQQSVSMQTTELSSYRAKEPSRPLCNELQGLQLSSLNSSRMSEYQQPSYSFNLGTPKRAARSRHSSISMRSEVTSVSTLDWLSDYDTRYSRAISKQSYNGPRQISAQVKPSESPIKVVEAEVDLEQEPSSVSLGSCSILSSIECRDLIYKGEQYSAEQDIERYKSLFENARAENESLTACYKELTTKLETQSTAQQVELESLRQANQALQIQLKQLVTASDFSGIVELYERSLEVERAKQTALSEQMIQLVKQTEEDGLHKALTLNLLKTQHELISKEAEIARMQGFERKWVLSRRCLDNLNKRSKEMHSLIDKQASQLEDYEFELGKTTQELTALRNSYRGVSMEAKTHKDHLDELQGEIKVTKRIERVRSVSSSPSKDRSAELIMKRLQRELVERRQHSAVRLANDLSIEIQGLYRAMERAYSREQNLVSRLAEVRLEASMPSP
jgi:hypothetical protein